MPRSESGRVARIPTTALAAAVTAATALGALLPADASARFGDRTLRKGSRGHDVRVLQSWLTHLGIRTRVDGSYGRRTVRNVRRFERREEIRRDGKVSRAQARLLRRRLRERLAEDGRRTRAGSGAGDTATVYLGARRRPALEVEAREAGPVEVEVVRTRDGSVVHTITADLPGPGTHAVAWDGKAGDAPAPEGGYRLRLASGASARAAAQEAAFTLRHHLFPVRGRHDYGERGARFHADRGGRSHRGQDVFARCGVRLAAAQGGTVKYAGYHSAAGHYIVVTGAGSGEDYVYMHLQDPVRFEAGDRVSTGRTLGRVGATGNASGCHLHFELWAKPGWYSGGDPYDPLPSLEAWDGWS